MIKTSDFPLKLYAVARRCRRCGARCFLSSQGGPLVTLLQPCPPTSCLDSHQTGEDGHFCRRQKNRDTECSMFLVSHMYRPSFVSLRKPCGGGGMNGRNLYTSGHLYVWNVSGKCLTIVYNNVGPVARWHTKDLLTEISIRRAYFSMNGHSKSKE